MTESPNFPPKSKKSGSSNSSVRVRKISKGTREKDRGRAKSFRLCKTACLDTRLRRIPLNLMATMLVASMHTMLANLEARRGNIRSILRERDSQVSDDSPSELSFFLSLVLYLSHPRNVLEIITRTHVPGEFLFRADAR